MSDLDLSTLAAHREEAEKISLVLCIFYLEDFKDRDISDEKLLMLQRQANTVRDAHLKMIVRFAYTLTDGSPPPGDDAPLSWVLRHLDQLTPFFRRNRDVIGVVESGFVGTWGWLSPFANSSTMSSSSRALITRSCIPSVMGGTSSSRVG